MKKAPTVRAKSTMSITVRDKRRNVYNEHSSLTSGFENHEHQRLLGHDIYAEGDVWGQ